MRLPINKFPKINVKHFRTKRAIQLNGARNNWTSVQKFFNKNIDYSDICLNKILENNPNFQKKEIVEKIFYNSFNVLSCSY